MSFTAVSSYDKVEASWSDVGGREKERKEGEREKPKPSGTTAGCRQCPNPKCGAYVPNNVLEKFSPNSFCSVCLKDM